MLLDQAARILPAIKQAVLLEHTAAFRPMTESGACIASHAPGWRNVYLANGGGAKGILLSVAIAQRVRQLLQQDHAAAI
jgi:glycine/D-amino acid oxidase-like deaminating enzyme